MEKSPDPSQFPGDIIVLHNIDKYFIPWLYSTTYPSRSLLHRLHSRDMLMVLAVQQNHTTDDDGQNDRFDYLVITKRTIGWLVNWPNSFVHRYFKEMITPPHKTKKKRQ